MTKKMLVVVAVIVVLVGGGSFYGGMKYARSAADVAGALSQSPGRTLGQAARRQGNFGSGTLSTGTFTAGDIIAKDNNSITVKLSDGGSKIVFYSDTSEISKFVNGAAGDLTVGKSVTVTGTANQDGSITAQSIQIRPATPTRSPAQ